MTATGTVNLSQAATILISTPNQTVEAGAGSHTIQFIGGSGGDRVILASGETDQVYGFVPGSDSLGLSTLLAGASGFAGGTAGLAGFVTVGVSGTDLTIGFDPSGQGGGSTVAVLHGIGDSIQTLSGLIAAKALVT